MTRPSPSLLPTLWRTPFLRAACIAMFISGIAVSATMPQMSLFLTTELHLPIEVAGLYYLVNLVAPLAGFLIGSLSERLPNRLFLYRFCAIVGAIGWMAMAFANRPWLPFVIGACVLSLGGGAMGQLFAATRDELSRHPTPMNNRIIAAVRMCFSAGWIVGPVLGSWFGAAFGLRALLIATSLLTLSELIPLGRRRVEPFVHHRAMPRSDGDQPATTRTARASTRNSLLPLLIFLGCSVLIINGDTIKFAYLPLYMEDDLRLSDTLRGAVIAVQPFLELLLMPLFARLSDRITPIWVLTIASALGIGANLAYAFSSSVAGLFLGQFLMSGVWAAMAGLGITIAQQLAPERVGLASSLYGSTLPLASAMGGSLGALGVSWLGMPQLFFIPAVLSALGFVGLILTARRFRPDDSAFTTATVETATESP